MHFDINEREIDKYLVYHSPFDKLNNWLNAIPISEQNGDIYIR